METIINKIYEHSFFNYRTNYASDEEVILFSQQIKNQFNHQLETSYLDFLKRINGFELNGLNFYGTNSKPDICVMGAFEQNIFWKTEIHGLEKFYLIGDGDVDFYCFDAINNNYPFFLKSALTPVGLFTSFDEAITNMIDIYIH